MPEGDLPADLRATAAQLGVRGGRRGKARHPELVAPWLVGKKSAPKVKQIQPPANKYLAVPAKAEPKQPPLPPPANLRNPAELAPEVKPRPRPAPYKAPHSIAPKTPPKAASATPIASSSSRRVADIAPPKAASAASTASSSGGAAAAADTLTLFGRAFIEERVGLCQATADRLGISLEAVFDTTSPIEVRREYFANSEHAHRECCRRFRLCPITLRPLDQ